MIRKETVYRIGRIGKPHGVDGEVSFHFDDDAFDRTDVEYLILDVDGILVPFFMDAPFLYVLREALVKFCDITTQDQARQLTGADVYFPREHAEADDGQLSWAQIVGFSVRDAETGKVVGEIHSVDDSTINTLFELVTPEGGDLLIPATDELISDINTEERIIEMNLPEGLLSL